MDQRWDYWFEKARALHGRALVLDSHCDTTQRLLQPGWDFSLRHEDGQVDIPRLHEGGVGAIVLAVYAGGPLEKGAGPAAARAQLDCIRATVQRHENLLAAARTPQDVQDARRGGRLAVLIGIEGGYLIEDSLEVLREYHQRGAVYMTLTHSFHTSWADSSGVHDPLAPLHGGLTDFGREVVREMNRLGMIVDVSHVSDDSFRDALEVSTSPVIASHSSCRAISPHRRNLSDEMLRAVADKGGVVQLTFAAAFVDPEFPPVDATTLKYWTAHGLEQSPYALHRTPLTRLADHFEHAIRLIGADHVGIGSDFDGVSALPEGMEDCSRLPALTAELLRRGFSEEELEQVLGLNFLRVLEECQIMAPIGSRAVRPWVAPALVLASASPRRADLLRQAGYEIEVITPLFEEPPPPPHHEHPARWAEQVSLQKARSVTQLAGGRLILAGDTIAVLDHRIIGKPADRREAKSILQALAGTTHRVISALCLLDAATGRHLLRHEVTRVTMRRLSDQAIEKYLDSEEWRGKAGAYGIQDQGDAFVEGIEGSFSNVVGLPLELLECMLREWRA